MQCCSRAGVVALLCVLASAKVELVSTHCCASLLLIESLNSLRNLAVQGPFGFLVTVIGSLNSLRNLLAAHMTVRSILVRHVLRLFALPINPKSNIYPLKVVALSTGLCHIIALGEGG